MFNWKEWTPWDYPSDTKIKTIVSELPSGLSVPLRVRLIENPASPFNLGGATPLEVHDVVHVILGRGLLNQDECFVIGMCMGASSSSDNLKRFLFEFFGKNFYPSPYKFTENELKVFHMAYDLAQEFFDKASPLHLLDVDYFSQLTVQQARHFFGITNENLYSWYEQERRLVPNSQVSQRLPSRSKFITTSITS